MNRRTFVAGSLAAALPATPLFARTDKASMQPPVARRGNHRFTLHGVTVEDPYAWIRDKGYPKVDDAEVLAYLNAENAYFEGRMAEHSGLVETLYGELKGRVKEADASVPHPDGDWLYWWAFDAGGQYRNWYRKPRNPANGAGGPDRLILSEPKLAEGKEYFRLGAFDVSPDGRLLAYSTDTDGAERYTLVIRDIESGRDLETVSKETKGGTAWTADSSGLLWTNASPEWRSTEIALHKVGSGQSHVLLTETDSRFGLYLGTTQDRRWIVLGSNAADTTEIRLLAAADPDAPALLVRPRKENVRYQVDSRGDTLFVLTNDDHVNFRIATAPASDPASWTTL
ncbi:MAG: S9 family peptidase, partial [Sandaracinobacteroides sp.]